MVFMLGTSSQNVELCYENHYLKQVTKFTYLGVTVSANDKFYLVQKTLAAQATDALFSLNCLS